MRIRDKRTYIKDLVDNILLRDIEQRYKVAYKESFKQMAQHLLNIAPSPIVISDLAKTFHFRSEHTVKNYVAYLRQAFLLIGIKKFSTKNKIRMSHEKIYTVDVSLMNKRENAFSGENVGWRLETIVLVQLLRRCKLNGWDLYYLSAAASAISWYATVITCFRLYRCHTIFRTLKLCVASWMDWW